MNKSQPLVADALSTLEEAYEPVEVSLSNELVQLLSEQLYQSPLKAVEELVVNAYDADASECRLYVPAPSDQDAGFVVVFDDGIGMDYKGLVDLWQIGRSNKRNEEIERRRKRKQIGKFGIGKLATYTIANRLTYITRTQDQTLSVTVDFSDFTEDPTGAREPIKVPVRNIDNWGRFVEKAYVKEICNAACIDTEKLSQADATSWTIAILEELKPKASKMTQGRLRWVLSTAMPLRADFRLYLNCDEVVSSKLSYKKAVSFQVSELPKSRLESLRESTGEGWRAEDHCLVSQSFESGVSGSVIVAERSLYTGKSADLGRSHGFFVRVRDRLLNEDDPLFGVKPRSYRTFNRFRADIQADDLDVELKAPRETIEESKLREDFRILLQEVFNEARQRYEDYIQTIEGEERRKREGERSVVGPRLVEFPVADAITAQASDQRGAEADESWFYLEVDAEIDLGKLIRTLYTEPRRDKYQYQYTKRGPSGRLVKFNPMTWTFSINEDHEFVRAHYDDGRARVLLEDLVTAEALLEAYLRESQVPASVVGEVLEHRDALLRSLAKDHPFSLEAISVQLRDAVTEEHDLEIALVVAARALGFVAKHISGSGEPDGIARFIEYPRGEKKITLEAKSSEEVPSLSAIDFAGLHDHMKRYDADGCLLLAPSYPGSSRREDSAAATRARQQKISCWTVEQLARFVAAAESRQLTARHVLDIVLEHFSPDDVKEAIDALLAEPSWDIRELYKAILKALRRLEGRLSDSPRTIDMVATKVSDWSRFTGIDVSDVEKAVRELTASSQGAMTLRDGAILIHVSYDELDRRLEGLTKCSGEPRRLSHFRGNCNLMAEEKGKS
jgi:hypothetical protein